MTATRRPVFVIHGLSVRGEDAYREQVESLARTVDFNEQVEFVPVYWGNRGADVSRIPDILPDVLPPRPGQGTAERRMRQLGAFPSSKMHLQAKSVRTTTPARRIAEAALEGLAGSGSTDAAHVLRIAEAPPSIDRLEELIAQALARDPRLAAERSPEALRLLGELLALELAAPGQGIVPMPAGVLGVPAIVRAFFGWLSKIGGTLGANGLAVLLTLVRQVKYASLARFMGDLLIYQRHQEDIHNDIRNTIAGHGGQKWGTDEQHRATVVGHSLGGVIAFDMATQGEPLLWIKTLVALGSQPAFFHLVDPRHPPVDKYDGRAVELPKTIEAWENFWTPWDPLAFTVDKVFQLSGGKKPKEHEVKAAGPFDDIGHQTYWTSRGVARTLKDILKEEVRA